MARRQRAIARPTPRGEPALCQARRHRGRWGRRRTDRTDTAPPEVARGGVNPSYAPAGLTMAYKLLDAAQARWRCVNAPHLVALVRAGATFVDGFIIEREDQWDAA